MARTPGGSGEEKVETRTDASIGFRWGSLGRAGPASRPLPLPGPWGSGHCHPFASFQEQAARSNLPALWARFPQVAPGMLGSMQDLGRRPAPPPPPAPVLGEEYSSVVSDPETFPAGETPPAFSTPTAMSPLTQRKARCRVGWGWEAGWQRDAGWSRGREGEGGRVMSPGRQSRGRRSERKQ